MSILIKGMEMPEHCGYCRFRYDGICHALQKTQYRKEECPLVPVPPHGDMIDKKKLSDDLQRRWNVSDDQDFCNKEVWYALEEAPTIIEADE